MSIGAEIISLQSCARSCDNTQDGSKQGSEGRSCHGSVRFKNFEAAFFALSQHFENISFRHHWYTDWSKYRPDELKVENSFLDAMFESLNDDCVSEVLKYLNPLQLLYLSKRDVRVSNVIASRMASFVTCVNITETIGTIEIMNFQHLLLEFGTNIYDLHISVKAFSTKFAVHSWDIKFAILFGIVKLMQNLKKLTLIGFDLYSEKDVWGTEDYIKCKNLIDFMKARGVEVVYHDIAMQLPSFVGSFRIPKKYGN